MNVEELMAFAGRNPMLSLALAGLTAAIIYTGFKAIKPAELTRLVNAGNAVVVDLSAPADFEKGHIAGSRNVQAKQFGPTHKLVANAKQQPVVLVDRTSLASASAAKVLKKAGFEQIYVLDGGLPSWSAADLPLVAVLLNGYASVFFSVTCPLTPLSASSPLIADARSVAR